MRMVTPVCARAGRPGVGSGPRCKVAIAACDRGSQGAVLPMAQAGVAGYARPAKPGGLGGKRLPLLLQLIDDIVQIAEFKIFQNVPDSRFGRTIKSKNFRKFCKKLAKKLQEYSGYLLILAGLLFFNVDASARNLAKHHYVIRRTPIYIQNPEFFDNGGSVAIESTINLALSEITSHVGVIQNFVIVRANVETVMAGMANGKRVLYYNPVFLKSVHDNVDPDWSVRSILAHEMGHHFLGHLFVTDRNFRMRELEADSFSGFVLYRLGATLPQALITMRTLAPVQETPTHPNKVMRLAAIEQGWRSAQAITRQEQDFALQRQTGRIRVDPTVGM